MVQLGACDCRETSYLVGRKMFDIPQYERKAEGCEKQEHECEKGGEKVKNDFNMRNTSINRIKEMRSRNKFEKMVTCAISMCH